MYSDSLFYSHTMSLVVAFTSLLLSFVAFASNFSFLYVVVRQPVLRKFLFQVYLVALSCVDLFLSIGYMLCGLSSVLTFYNFHKYKGFFSTTFLFMLMVSYSTRPVSSFFIIRIAWERYKAVCHAVESMGSASLFQKCFFVAVMWQVFFSTIFVLILIALFVTDKLFLPFLGNTEKYFVYVSDILTVIISVCLYVKIIWRLRKQQNLHPSSDTRHEKEQQKLTLMVIVNTLAYLLLVFLQDFIAFFAMEHIVSDDSILQELWYDIASMCACINSGINPLIYNVFGSRYHDAFLDTLPFMKCFWSGSRQHRKDILAY